MTQALLILHQVHHWKTAGPTFYGDHLLYQRLYEDSQELLDSLAEKIAGVGGHELIVPSQLMEGAHLLIDKITSTFGGEGADAMANCSLQAEKMALIHTDQVLAQLQEADAKTNGVEDLLQGHASKREEFVYLLKQRNG
jgi:DNA-binding ferritin-like protein